MSLTIDNVEIQNILVNDTEISKLILDDIKVWESKPKANVYGIILVEEGGNGGTWKLVDQNFNEVEFDTTKHGTWAGMKTLTLDSGDEVVEIPTTWVKTEILESGPYAGKTCWWTADGEVEGFHVHPAFMKTNGEPGMLRVGSYLASKGTNDVPMSVDTADSSDMNNYWMRMSYGELRSTALTKNTDNETDWRAYNAYDHHFLARLMLTEFGTANIQSIDGWDGSTRIDYHGIHDPFSLPASGILLDGLTTENSVWNVLAPDGSGDMINTNDSKSIAEAAWIINCRIDTVNGIDFGDLFIGDNFSSNPKESTFPDFQDTYGNVFCVYWYNFEGYGAFSLYGIYPTEERGWRLSQVV